MSFKLFFRTLLLSGIFAIVVILFLVNLISNQVTQIKEVEEKQIQSLMVAYEMRQSSDDLSRLARTFAATSNSKYEKMYNDIISIRNGEKPRPKNYNRIYWDLVLEYGQKPKPDGEKISLDQMMIDAGFTKREFALIEKAEKMSAELVKLETIAMNIAKGIYQDKNGDFTVRGDVNNALAVEITHSDEYHVYKARIVQPIDDFLAEIDRRTAKEVQTEIDKNNMYLYILFSFIVSHLQI